VYDMETPDKGKRPPAWKEKEEEENPEVVEERVDAGNKEPKGLNDRAARGGTSGRGRGGNGFSLLTCSLGVNTRLKSGRGERRGRTCRGSFSCSPPSFEDE